MNSFNCESETTLSLRWIKRRILCDRRYKLSTHLIKTKKMNRKEDEEEDDNGKRAKQVKKRTNFSFRFGIINGKKLSTHHANPNSSAHYLFCFISFTLLVYLQFFRFIFGLVFEFILSRRISFKRSVRVLFFFRRTLFNTVRVSNEWCGADVRIRECLFHRIFALNSLSF